MQSINLMFLRKCLRKIKGIIAHEEGVVAIEFSFISVIFIFMIFLVVEINRYIFVSSAIDLTLSEAAQISSRQSSSTTDYAQMFKKNVEEQSKLWVFFIDEKNIHATVRFCDSVQKIINDGCQSTTSDNKVLAVYQIEYDYEPLIFNGSVPGAGKLISALRTSLSRSLIYVQEYEKDDIFKDI